MCALSGVGECAGLREFRSRLSTVTHYCVLFSSQPPGLLQLLHVGSVIVEQASWSRETYSVVAYRHIRTQRMRELLIWSHFMLSKLQTNKKAWSGLKDVEEKRVCFIHHNYEPDSERRDGFIRLQQAATQLYKSCSFTWVILSALCALLVSGTLITRSFSPLPAEHRHPELLIQLEWRDGLLRTGPLLLPHRVRLHRSVAGQPQTQLWAGLWDGRVSDRNVKCEI